MRATLTILISVALASAYLLTPKMEYLPQGNRNLVLNILVPPPGLSVTERVDIGERFYAMAKPHIGVDADGIPAARSRLRIFTRSGWDSLEEQIHRPASPNDLRLRQERVEEQKEAMASYAADVSGTLEVVGRGTSFLADRILRALSASRCICATSASAESNFSTPRIRSMKSTWMYWP